MRKAVLVMDMPENCIDCRFCREINEGTEACCEIEFEPEDDSLCRMIYNYCQEKPGWCPLRHVPDKKNITLSTIHFKEGQKADTTLALMRF